MENQDNEMLNAKGKGKAFFKKAGQKLKTASLAPQRGAYLFVLRENIFGGASHLKSRDPKKYAAARDAWYKFGGNRTEFDKVVAKGAKKKPIMFGFKQKKGADGIYYGIEGINDANFLNVAGYDDAAIAATVASATPIIVSVVKAAGKPKEMDDSSANEIAATAAAKATETQKGLDEQAAITKANGGIEPDAEGKDSMGNSTTGMPMWGWVAIGVGVTAIIGGLIYWKTKK